jgi:hypothetical protein
MRAMRCRARSAPSKQPTEVPDRSPASANPCWARSAPIGGDCCPAAPGCSTPRPFASLRLRQNPRGSRHAGRHHLTQAAQAPEGGGVPRVAWPALPSRRQRGARRGHFRVGFLRAPRLRRGAAAGGLGSRGRRARWPRRGQQGVQDGYRALPAAALLRGADRPSAEQRRKARLARFWQQTQLGAAAQCVSRPVSTPGRPPAWGGTVEHRRPASRWFGRPRSGEARQRGR